MLNTVEELQADPVRPAPGPSRRREDRWSGTAVSLLLHGGFLLAAWLGVGAPGTGRGGGVPGLPGPGSEAGSYTALIEREDSLDPERFPDSRVYALPESEPPAALEAVPPPAEDFIRDQAGERAPVAHSPAPAEPRVRRTYEQLPPAGGGNADVKGAGGDRGGAGEGTNVALFMPSPDYPVSARRRGIEGVVVVRVDVHPDGHCENAKIVETSGCQALDDAALAAIRKWRYETGSELSVRRVRFVFKLAR